MLKQATRWVHAVEPGMPVSFGVFTCPKYNPTAYRMWRAWVGGTGYLGRSARCWLNIVPVKGAEVKMAAKFLSHVYG